MGYDYITVQGNVASNRSANALVLEKLYIQQLELNGTEMVVLPMHMVGCLVNLEMELKHGGNLIGNVVGAKMIAKPNL